MGPTQGSENAAIPAEGGAASDQSSVSPPQSGASVQSSASPPQNGASVQSSVSPPQSQGAASDQSGAISAQGTPDAAASSAEGVPSGTNGGGSTKPDADAFSNPWLGYSNEDGSDLIYLEKGTEVSKFQNDNGAIDWEAAKADGLDFVIVRLAYGLKEDPYFDQNVKGAQAAGLKVGAYLCSTAKNMDEAVAEANLTIRKIKKYKLQYPVAYDAEVNDMLSEGATPEILTAMANKYCAMVKAAGYTPIVYANRTWLTEYMNIADIPYDIWFAAYPQDRVYRPVKGSNTTIWQSGEAGTVKGIKGNVTTEFSWKAYGGGSPSRKNAGSGGSAKKGSLPATGSNSGSGKVSGNSGGGSAANTNNKADGNGVSDGWTQKNGKWYYYEKRKKVSGWKQVSKLWYYMDGDGVMQTGWVRDGGNWYYLKQDGQMASGWTRVSESWYFLKPNGVMATNWANVGGRWFYLGSDGRMVSGWTRLDKKWYYLGDDGAMATGWKTISGNWYYLGKDGVMAADGTKKIDGTNYRFDKSGVWLA